MRPRQVVILMASIAAHRGHSVTVNAPFYVLNVYVTIVALQRSITFRMTILAARRNQYFVDLQERRLRRIPIGLWPPVAVCS
jgi:hypothetical protein